MNGKSRWKAEIVGRKPTDSDSEDSSDKVYRSGAHIWFYRDVSQESIMELTRLLTEGAQEMLREQATIGSEEPRPLQLHIHSYGGELFAGLAAADAVRNCRVPVHTHIEGGAASAATIFSVMGAHRTIGKHSFILIHQLSSIFWGKYEEWVDEMKNNDLLMETLRGIYAERTKLKKRDVTNILKKDLWYDAEKALEVGLVDEVL